MAFANYPTPQEMNTFYNQYVEEGKATLPGTRQTTNAALEAFTNQHFMLWDYNIGVAKTDLHQHYAVDVLNMLKARQMGRLIVFIRDPSTTSYFELPNGQFVADMNNIYNTMKSIQSDFYITVFFESNSPANLWQYTPQSPTNDPTETFSFPKYYKSIRPMMDWAYDAVNLVEGIKEIAFDPEGHGATKSVQQELYNYADNYRGVNSDRLANIKLGTTIGVSESKVTFANLMEFPVPTLFTGAISTFPPNPNRHGHAQALSMLQF